MTRVLPVLPTDLTKASTYDLITYLNTRLAERAEFSAPCPFCEPGDAAGCFHCDGSGTTSCEGEYEEILSDITTELLTRAPGFP
jgi:uncharacterized protein CbrC (UPF0167 family)